MESNNKQQGNDKNITEILKSISITNILLIFLSM